MDPVIDEVLWPVVPSELVAFDDENAMLLLGLQKGPSLDTDQLKEIIETHDWKAVQFYRRRGSYDVKMIIPGCPMAVCCHQAAHDATHDQAEVHLVDADEVVGKSNVLRLSPPEAFRLRPALTKLIETFA